MKQTPIIFIFNSPFSSGCDYVLQTMRIVARDHPTYGLALGDIISLAHLFTENDTWFIRRTDEMTIVRPISLLPFVRFRFVRMCTYVIWAMIFRLFLAVRYFGRSKIMWFFEPFHISKLLPIFFGYTTIYDCVDFYPAFNAQAKLEHECVLRTASLVFANSKPLGKILQKERPDIQVVPLGFVSELFSRMPLQIVPHHSKRFVVGFVGGISDRIDFSLVQKVVSMLPNLQFVFVGPLEKHVYGSLDTTEARFGQLLRYPNVTWRHEVPKSQIPKIIASFDIGIIPYNVRNWFNHMSFPMKTLEYFAMGRPVVSTNILSLVEYNERKLLRIISGPKEFAHAIKDIRRIGWTRDVQEEQREEAEKMSWKRKITLILSTIDKMGSGTDYIRDR